MQLSATVVLIPMMVSHIPMKSPSCSTWWNEMLYLNAVRRTSRRSLAVIISVVVCLSVFWVRCCKSFIGDPATLTLDFMYLDALSNYFHVPGVCENWTTRSSCDKVTFQWHAVGMNECMSVSLLRAIKWQPREGKLLTLDYVVYRVSEWLRSRHLVEEKYNHQHFA